MAGDVPFGTAGHNGWKRFKRWNLCGAARNGMRATGTKHAARRRREGKSVDIRDTQIAGIATVRRATLATRNTRHFEGLEVEVVNPWTD